MTATTNEVAFNTVFAEALRSKNPRWKNYIGAEQGNILIGASGKRPDIVVAPPGTAPVLVETEFLPAGTVEQDASARIGMTLKHSGKTIENVIAIRIPESLKTVVQAELRSAIEEAEFDTVLVRATSDGTIRWPESGWLNQRVDDIATSIETVAISEQLIADGMNAFRDGVESCAQLLKDAEERGFADTADAIAEILHQEPSGQTTRMGMAILANAFNFHNAIVVSRPANTL